jgi:hypothetical protein
VTKNGTKISSRIFKTLLPFGLEGNIEIGMHELYKHWGT